MNCSRSNGEKLGVRRERELQREKEEEGIGERKKMPRPCSVESRGELREGGRVRKKEETKKEREREEEEVKKEKKILTTGSKWRERISL